MSRRLRTAARALEDVRSIARWIARDNPPAAIKWVDDLNHEFVKIAQTPGIGTDRSDLRPALRSLAFGNYLVFFKTFRGSVIVVRVVHGARDYRHIIAPK